MAKPRTGRAEGRKGGEPSATVYAPGRLGAVVARGQDPDCTWLEHALADIEPRSDELPWHRDAGTRWEVAERVDVEWSDELGALPRVDLHGLDQRLAREVVTRVIAGRTRLRAHAVRFVVGSGTHSRDGRGVLGDVVEGCVDDATGVSVHPSRELPWRDVIFTPVAVPAALLPAAAAARERRRRVSTRSAMGTPPPGALGRVFRGIVLGLLDALFGGVLRAVAGMFGAPGRAFARALGRRRRKRRK